VLADFIQLTPDRTLTLKFHSDELVTFNLRGYGPGERTSNYITASLQIHDPGIPGELGWVEKLSSGPIYGTPTNKPNYWSFSGRLMLPAARGSKPMRILVQEYETYVVDREYYFAGAPPKGSRVVYADAVEI
jgi:hypothetical protein